jgi:hypothetical protein
MRILDHQDAVVVAAVMDAADAAADGVVLDDDSVEGSG